MARTLQEDFDAEFTRLLASGLTQEDEAIARRYYSDKEREAMDESDFAGPHRSFPIKTQADVYNAARLIGHAEDPEAVKRKIIAIAQRKGFKLPDAWQEEEDKKDSKERSMGTTHVSPQEVLAASQTLTRAANHEPMKGKHSHAHVAYGSQGDDATHEHEHEHGKSGEPDNNHEPSEQHEHEDTAERATGGTINAVMGGFSLSFPIVRTDPKTWAVGGTCTAERPDRHGTIFSYEGAKGAMERWPGNVREQHKKDEAVGHWMTHRFDDERKEVYLEAFISKTRPDTWERVQEGILNDFSVSVIPAEKYGTDPRKWPKKEYNGKLYPYLPEYDYAEISLVDACSLPGSHFVPIMRADGTPTEELARAEEAPAPEPPTIDRAGARVSAETRSALHEGIAHSLRGVMANMKNCGCDECQTAMKLIDPDGDGDIDLGGYGDSDGDATSLYDGLMQDGTEKDVARVVESVLDRVLEPKITAVYARLQGIAGALARSQPGPAEGSLDSVITGAIERAVSAATSSLSEVRADLSAVKETVGKIADTPVPGAPVLNTGSLPRPALPKQLPTDPRREDAFTPPQRSGSAVADAMRQLYEAGYLNTEDKQVDAMAAGLQLMRGQQPGGR